MTNSSEVACEVMYFLSSELKSKRLVFSVEELPDIKLDKVSLQSIFNNWFRSLVSIFPENKEGELSMIRIYGAETSDDIVFCSEDSSKLSINERKNLFKDLVEKIEKFHGYVRFEEERAHRILVSFPQRFK